MLPDQSGQCGQVGIGGELGQRRMVHIKHFVRGEVPGQCLGIVSQEYCRHVAACALRELACPGQHHVRGVQNLTPQVFDDDENILAHGCLPLITSPAL